MNIYLSGLYLDFDCRRLRDLRSSTSGCSFGLFLFVHHVTGVYDFGSERYFSFPRIHRGQVLIEAYFDKTASAHEPRTFLLAASEEGYVNYFLCAFTTQMFQNPCMIVLTIAATRMYRSLTNLFSTDM